jgi:hypothetical protein
MNAFRLPQCTLNASAAAALLAGCGASQASIPASGVMPLLLGSETSLGESWMLPEAKTDDLLYVTNYSYVSMYTYPQGELVGILKGFGSSVGECVDNKQDVFITNQFHLGNIPGDAIAEFVHGGTKPIAELKTKHIGPVGCAVDPITGDLAVTGSGEPTVNIFKGARGKPTLYKDKDFVEMQFCGFDDKGNLFITGLKNFKGKPELAEFPKERGAFKEIRLDAVIAGGAGVQWDGKHLAIGAYASDNAPVIYRFRISGSQGMLAGTTTLGSSEYITQQLQFFIVNGALIIPNWYYVDSTEKKNVLFYDYPQGGSPTMTLTKRVTEPRGVAVSLSAGPTFLLIAQLAHRTNPPSPL